MNNTLVLDVLSIPQNMEAYTAATKTIAFALLPVLFTITALSEQAKLIRGEQTNFARLLYSTVLAVFTLTFFYSMLFTKIVSLCESLSLTMSNAYDWAAFQSLIGKPAEELQSVGIFKIGVISFLSSIIIMISSIAQYVFEFVRYVFLCLLYVIGPLCVAMAIYPPTKSMFKGWIMNVFQMSFWIVMLRILQGVILAVNVDMLKNPTAGKLVSAVPLSAAYLIFICLIPILTEKILSGENLGGVASAAMGVLSAVSGFGALGSLTAENGIGGALKTALGNTLKGPASYAKQQLQKRKRAATRRSRTPKAPIPVYVVNQPGPGNGNSYPPEEEKRR